MYNLFAKCKTEDDDCIELFKKQGRLGLCLQSRGRGMKAETPPQNN